MTLHDSCCPTCMDVSSDPPSPTSPSQDCGAYVRRLRISRGLSRRQVIDRYEAFIAQHASLPPLITEVQLKRLEAGQVVKINHLFLDVLAGAIACTPGERVELFLRAGLNPFADLCTPLADVDIFLARALAFLRTKTSVMHILGGYETNTSQTHMTDEFMMQLLTEIVVSIADNAHTR